MRYLIFTLAAPMASFGAVAVGERRPTWDRPSKSQVIGLIAGALGIERQEAERQQALAASLGFAVRIDDPGQLASDYHTTQVPPSRRNRRFATRAEELAVAKEDLKTILSRREYRTGSLYTIAVWSKGQGAVLLDDIKTALERPVFVPFAGRKAHVLMLPMRPALVEADTIHAAFADFDTRLPEGVVELWRRLAIRQQAHRPVFIDADAAGAQAVDRLEERRDNPESRGKWRFGLRAEALLRAPASGGETP